MICDGKKKLRTAPSCSAYPKTRLVYIPGSETTDTNAPLNSLDIAIADVFIPPLPAVFCFDNLTAASELDIGAEKLRGGFMSLEESLLLLT